MVKLFLNRSHEWLNFKLECFVLLPELYFFPDKTEIRLSRVLVRARIIFIMNVLTMIRLTTHRYIQS